MKKKVVKIVDSADGYGWAVRFRHGTKSVNLDPAKSRGVGYVSIDSAQRAFRKYRIRHDMSRNYVYSVVV